MRRPACFFPDMLGTVDFAPTHPDGLGNGPYRIGDEFDADRGYYHLTPNPHVEDSDERPELVFRLQTDVDGAPERFLRGECDITCNTAFPLDRLDEWRRNSAMHRAPTGIYMQLEPNPSGEGPLARSVPAEGDVGMSRISPRSLRVFLAAFGRPCTERRDASRQGVDIPPRLCISYHDFYPNRAVLERLSMQWRDRLGMDIELVERDYADWGEDEADGSFVLRYLPFIHPYAHFDQCAILLKDTAFNRLLERFAAGDEGIASSHESSCANNTSDDSSVRGHGELVGQPARSRLQLAYRRSVRLRRASTH